MPTIHAKLVDILNRRIYPAAITFDEGKISSIEETGNASGFILPGFIDSHIHIESSMLIPSEFARIAVTHGTVGTVSDPHEIGNVLGVEGVEFMIENARKVPFKFNFGAPSCVPATTYETSGAEISTSQIDDLLARPDIKYLSEMMNWPGVINGEPIVLEKINIAKKHNKPVDGHAPGLEGALAKDYISAGISTDHECITYDEAKGKLDQGMKISIREGSAAKNFEALVPLIDEYPDLVMLCSDDKHPDELVEGHINILVRRAVERGLDLFNVLRVACINPIDHYKLEIGLLRPGDPADFIIVEDLDLFKVKQTYINGQLVADNNESRINRVKEKIVNNFSITEISLESLRVESRAKSMRVIEALDGQLVTKEVIEPTSTDDGLVIPNPSKDILKLVVINRYQPASPSICFIKNFGLKSGALASSVGHDSHNITAVGVDDQSLANAINLVIRSKGGISAVGKGEERILPLPFGGLMTDEDGRTVARHYTEIDRFAKSLGATLRSPFMTLSFMALLVIPDLKLSDRGLFSGEKFQFVDLFIGD